MNIAIEPFSNIIIPRLSAIKPETAFGLYYKILCSSLTDWIDQYLGNQIATVSGTMIVGNYTVPYIMPCLYSEPETVVLNPLQLQAESRSGMDLFPKIFEYFGWETQRRKLVEEINEFNDEVLLLEKGKGDIKNIIEELADCYILLKQFKEAYQITKEELMVVIRAKLNRTLERIESVYYEANTR